MQVSWDIKAKKNQMYSKLLFVTCILSSKIKMEQYNHVVFLYANVVYQVVWGKIIYGFLSWYINEIQCIGMYM